MEKTNQMTQEEIQTILKEIKYPGFNRDIVSFGMVKNTSLNENTVDISLPINSENTDLLNQLSSQIKNKFKALSKPFKEGPEQQGALFCFAVGLHNHLNQ